MEKTIKLRCYLKKEDNLWIATCIDLCLGAQSRHPKEAMDKLHEQIMDYMFDITQGELKDQFHEMFPRKAPLSIRFDFHLTVLKNKFRKLLGKKTKKFSPIFCEQVSYG